MKRAHVVAVVGCAIVASGLAWNFYYRSAPAARAPVAKTEQVGATPVDAAPSDALSSNADPGVVLASARAGAAQGLAGTWHQSKNLAGLKQPVKMETTVTLETNGSFSSELVMGKTTIRYGGTWHPEGDRLVFDRKSCQLEGPLTPGSEHDPCLKPLPPLKYVLSGDSLDLHTERPGAPVQNLKRVIPQ